MKMLKGVGNSTHGNKQEKLNAYDQKERKISLFTDDMIAQQIPKNLFKKKERKFIELVAFARFRDTRSVHKM